jgi:glycosyltransferase involved in cell wall biosynthesis
MNFLKSIKMFLHNSAVAPPDDFDVNFYRSFYDDLPSSLNDQQVRMHYMRFGIKEGRKKNASEFIKPLEHEYGTLPEHFDAATYQRLNPDIAQTIPNPWEATAHYLKYGVHEKRRFQDFDLELYKSLNGLDVSTQEAETLLHYNLNRASGRAAKSGADFMKMRELKGGGAWLERMNLAEFITLNWTWVPKGIDKIQAGDLVIAEGHRRLAPLSFDLQFDHKYYREAHPRLQHVNNAGLYRHWLFEGLEQNQAGTEGGRLKQIGLSLSEYPLAFDWQEYLKSQKLRRQDRWSAVEHFLHNNTLTTPPPLRKGMEASSFLVASARSFSSRRDGYAVQLLTSAAAERELDSGDMQVWADCLYRLEKWQSALRLYQAILEKREGHVWTLVNGARCHLQMKSPDEAEKVLKYFGSDFRGEAIYRQTVREVVDAVFKQEEAAAVKLYKKNVRDEADTVLLAAVEKCHLLWDALDPIGAPIAVHPDCKVVVLANTDLRQCTHYRVEQKAEILKQLGLKFEIFSADHVDEFLNALPGAAAAIFYRLPAFPKNVRVIETARRLGVPTYYEIDDLIFDNAYPDPIESYGGALNKDEYAGLQFGVPLFREAMRRCDYGISSTSDLAKEMEPIVKTGEVFVVVNGLDSRNKSLESAGRRRLRQDDDIILFYGSGTKAHNADFLDLVGPAVLDLFETNPKVRLVIVGFLVLDSRFDAFRNRVTQISFVPNIQSYWSILAEADINLAVLKPGPTTNGKSEIKWLEAAVLSVPSVVSDTQTYLNIIDDGGDGLIAATTEQWAVHLEALVASPALRAKIAKAAKQKALSAYSLRSNGERMKKALAPAFETRRVAGTVSNSAANPRRILIVNVFFPPQTIGGATRVVRDNLDYFLTHAPELQFAIASTDLSAPEPYRFQIDQYKNVPVFRFSTPHEMNMDWQPFNDKAGFLFGRILDIYRPHLVHFHATQRITASAVTECRRRKIPYIITAHDAWWIADYQFLIDDRGDLVDPNDVMGARPPSGVSLGDSLDRRRQLQKLLNGAQEVLGVSDSFSAIYKACGVNTTSIPNGINALNLEIKQTSSQSRVRLTHVGGQSAHKGYHLLEAALRQGDFSNLELTVVDHRRTGGETIMDLWGGTPIRFVGMTPQEAMGSFYAAQDVLLAPSIWPESFGLVAREALAAGLWVVASDRGAMGEDVKEDVNGYIVDVTSPQGLFEALSKINADPNRFKRSPPRSILRSSDDQGNDLLSLYKTLLSKKANQAKSATQAAANSQDSKASLKILQPLEKK